MHLGIWVTKFSMQNAKSIVHKTDYILSVLKGIENGALKLVCRIHSSQKPMYAK